MRVRNLYYKRQLKLQSPALLIPCSVSLSDDVYCWEGLAPSGVMEAGERLRNAALEQWAQLYLQTRETFAGLTQSRAEAPGGRRGIGM